MLAKLASYKATYVAIIYVNKVLIDVGFSFSNKICFRLHIDNLMSKC